MTTNEIEYKLYDHDATYGHVTYLKASGKMLAVGYSNGTILVIDLDLANATPDEDNDTHMVLATLHKFQFHRSSVTVIMFDDQNTQMYSGAQDTYIVIYDLVSDQAMFKLLGHKEEITQLAVFQMSLSGKQNQTILISASKDGFIKLWDLQQQFCMYTYSDALMNRI